MRLFSSNGSSSVRNIPNTLLESRVITKPQCLSIFRFELQQGYDLKVQGVSGYSCHTLRVKTTKAKNVKTLPYGAFFGFTQNEEDLFKSKDNYRLCIVHTGLKEFYSMGYE